MNECDPSPWEWDQSQVDYNSWSRFGIWYVTCLTTFDLLVLLYSLNFLEKNILKLKLKSSISLSMKSTCLFCINNYT